MRAVGLAIGAVAVGAALYFILSDEKGGPTADAVAKVLERSCDTLRKDTPDELADEIRAAGSRADEVVTVTCGGEIPPAATVYRFDSEAQAKSAIPTRTGFARTRKVCLVGKDIVRGSVIDENFVRFCQEIGGVPFRALAPAHI
jgi:hypothetical protein